MKPTADQPHAPAARIALLEAEVAALKAYEPMLARMAFFEGWAAKGSIPAHLIDARERAEHVEFARPAGETLPKAAQALQDAYDIRTGCPSLRSELAS